MRKLIIISLLFTTFLCDAQVLRAIRTSEGQFSGGTMEGKYDDGNLIMLGDSLHYMGGTDNTSGFNIHYVSGNKGVTWTAKPNAPWVERNAAGIAAHGGFIWFWGGNNYSGGLGDAWKYSPATGWVEVEDDMGSTWGSRQSFAFVYTGSEYIGIGGSNKTNVVASSNLTTWTVRGTLPVEIQNTGGMTAWYDPVRQTIWLTSGQSNEVGNLYPSKLYKSTDFGATWTVVLDDPLFANKWGNLTGMYTEDYFILIYIKGHHDTGGNQKGTYWSRDGLDWFRFNYEPGARHATPVCTSTDGTEAFAALGNFYNESWIFKRVDQ
jgi:hypothetical protein